MMMSRISGVTTQLMSSDSQPVLMPKSGSLSADSVWRDQFALSMLIDLNPPSEILSWN